MFFGDDTFDDAPATPGPSSSASATQSGTPDKVVSTGNVDAEGFEILGGQFEKPKFLEPGKIVFVNNLRSSKGLEYNSCIMGMGLADKDMKIVPKKGNSCPQPMKAAHIEGCSKFGTYFDMTNMFVGFQIANDAHFGISFETAKKVFPVDLAHACPCHACHT